MRELQTASSIDDDVSAMHDSAPSGVMKTAALLQIREVEEANGNRFLDDNYRPFVYRGGIVSKIGRCSEFATCDVRVAWKSAPGQNVGRTSIGKVSLYRRPRQQNPEYRPNGEPEFCIVDERIFCGSATLTGANGMVDLALLNKVKVNTPVGSFEMTEPPQPTSFYELVFEPDKDSTGAEPVTIGYSNF